MLHHRILQSCYFTSCNMGILLVALAVFSSQFIFCVRCSENIMNVELEEAASAPGVSLTEPNLRSLLALRNPLSTGSPSLLEGLGMNPLSPNLGSPISLQTLKDSGALANICSNGGNPDALANLLVYQYLSGSLPQTGVRANNIADVGNLQGIHPESRTTVSVTTTLTTRTITMEASTKFSTATTSFKTTVTSVTSSVLPIIFRGSKITTTITDRITEVLTATEYQTSSSVLTPSIIQTLNVEVTFTETSTKGPNGLFTFAKVTPGATKVIEKPISSSLVDLAGLRSLGTNGENAEVVNALTALLQQYNEDGKDNHNRQSHKEERDKGRSFGNTRFHSRSRFSSPEEESPKFNVIRGFTLSDRQSPFSKSEVDNSGSALENTRYSKFRKKNNLQSNSIRPSEQDRESEQFSASTNRRTVSRSLDRRRDINRRPRERRFFSNGFSRSSNIRRSRDTRNKYHHHEGNLHLQNNLHRTIIGSPPKARKHFRTTLLTMNLSGSVPGIFATTVRTVTLSPFNTARNKRHIANYRESPKLETIPKTQILDNLSTVGPSEIVNLFQNVDRQAVKTALYNLKDWVNYYLHQVLGENTEPALTPRKLKTTSVTLLPSLYTSENERQLDVSQRPTTALPLVSREGSNSVTPLQSISPTCLSTSVITETVFETIYISQFK